MTKYTLIALLSFLFFLQSCDKGCDFPADENKGIIVQDALVYGGNSGGVKVVYHEEPLSYDFKVSFDGGYSYVPIDWNQYAVLNFPVSAGCNTHYVRDVTDLGSELKYTLTVESCPDCEEEYAVDNWVLVPAFPTSKNVIYEKKVN